MDGYRQIYNDLTQALEAADIAAGAANLGLVLHASNIAEIPFMGHSYLVSNQGVRHSDGQLFVESIGSVLIHYIMRESREKPHGKYMI